MAATTSATSTLPAIYRFALLNIEPLLALNGALLVLFAPDRYLATMTRGAVSHVPSGFDFLFSQLAAGWLSIAFTEAVVLRLVDDLRVWRLLCLAILCSDAAYCHSCAQGVGGWAVWVDLRAWTAEDWAVELATWPFVVLRLLIVFGVGLRHRDAGVGTGDGKDK